MGGFFLPVEENRSFKVGATPSRGRVGLWRCQKGVQSIARRVISIRSENWLSFNRFRPVSGSHAVSFRPAPKRSVGRLGAKPMSFRLVLKQGPSLRAARRSRRAMPIRPVPKPVRQVSSRGMAFHLRTARKTGFALQRPCAFLRLTGLHARQFPHSLRYCTIFYHAEPSAGGRFPLANGSSSGLSNAKHRESGIFFSARKPARFPISHTLRDMGSLRAWAIGNRARLPTRLVERLVPRKAGSSGSLDARPPRRPWIAYRGEPAKPLRAWPNLPRAHVRQACRSNGALHSAMRESG